MVVWHWILLPSRTCTVHNLEHALRTNGLCGQMLLKYDKIIIIIIVNIIAVRQLGF